jgi:hypothetical protein
LRKRGSKKEREREVPSPSLFLKSVNFLLSDVGIKAKRFGVINQSV